MIQQIVRIGSFFLIASVCLSAMEEPALKQIATKRVAELAAYDLRYCVQAFYKLPLELSTSVIQNILLANKSKSALSVVLLAYKHYQQQQADTKQCKIHLTCSSDKQVPLTIEQSNQLIQASASIRNLIQDIEDIQDTAIQVEDIPLPLLTDKQVTALLPYISIINALNATTSTLPIVQQDIPGTTVLSPYWLNYTALQQLKECLIACTVPMLCELIIAAIYLDMQASEQTFNLIELAAHALGDKLLQSPHYQDDYNVINTLPANVQRLLVHYLVDNSAIRYILCGNSTDVIARTAQTLTGHDNKPVNSVSWSPDGSKLAVSSYKAIRMWNADNSTYINTVNDHTDLITQVSWSPDGTYIASGSWDTTIKIWDASTGTCIRTLTGHTDRVRSVSWSPDNKYIASGSADGIIRVWNTSTGTYIYILEGHSYPVKSVVWSFDGSMIASSSYGEIKIWDATASACIHILKGNCNWVNSISWSPDGSMIASGSGDGIVRIWDASKGTCIHTFEGHTNSVNSVSWSPNGKHIASSSDDRTVRIWDTTTGICRHTLTGHTGWIHSVSWSSDSSKLASSSNDATVRVWNIIKKLDSYLKTRLSWEQALLLIHIITAYNGQYPVDFAQDRRALQCYNSLDQGVIKQLVEPLLSEKTRTATHITKNLEKLTRTNPVRAALFGVGLQIGRAGSLRK